MLQDFAPNTFGILNAEDYDELHNPGTTQQTVDLIAELSGGKNLLELAIGTGRIALPLAERGFSITGIDGSPEMVEKLREKPGGKEIQVTIGDMAELKLDTAGPATLRGFDHAYLVFNTLFNLLSQQAQVSCFKNVANHLRPGGTFLIDTFIPDLSRFQDGQSVRLMRLTNETVWLDAGQHDPVTQRLDFQRVRIKDGEVRLVPLPLRYAWPAELDLMAQLAGLTLKHRWGDWDRSPFAADSKMHVSVYEKAGEASRQT